MSDDGRELFTKWVQWCIDREVLMRMMQTIMYYSEIEEERTRARIAYKKLENLVYDEPF